MSDNLTEHPKITEDEKASILSALSFSTLFTDEHCFDKDFYNWIEENFPDRKPLVRLLNSLQPSETMGEIQWECPDCQKTIPLPASKTKLLIWVKSNERQCQDCKKAEEKRRDEERERERKEYVPPTREQIEKAGLEYCEIYLNPNRRWEEKTKQYHKMRQITGYDPMIEDFIEEYIKKMEYGDFLKTPYWKAVAGEVRKKSGYRCSMCDSNGLLHVHHRSYKHHGREHTYYGMKDLICICEDCHSIHHSE